MTSSQRAYNAVRNAVTRSGKRALRERSLRVKTVAHGELTVGEFEKAFRRLQSDGVLIVGGGWVTVSRDAEWRRESLEYVVNREDEPRGFVAAVNRHSR